MLTSWAGPSCHGSSVLRPQQLLERGRARNFQEAGDWLCVVLSVFWYQAVVAVMEWLVNTECVDWLSRSLFWYPLQCVS